MIGVVKVSAFVDETIRAKLKRILVKLGLIEPLEHQIAKITEEDAKAIHPKLARDLEVSVYSYPNVASRFGEEKQIIEVHVKWKWPKWKYVIFGTKPHRICARLWRQCGRPDPMWRHAAKALRYVVNGVVKVRKWTWHPGVKGRAELLKKMEEDIKEVVKKWLGI